METRKIALNQRGSFSKDGSAMWTISMWNFPYLQLNRSYNLIYFEGETFLSIVKEIMSCNIFADVVSI